MEAREELGARGPDLISRERSASCLDFYHKLVKTARRTLTRHLR